MRHPGSLLIAVLVLAACDDGAVGGTDPLPGGDAAPAPDAGSPPEAGLPPADAALPADAAPPALDGAPDAAPPAPDADVFTDAAPPADAGPKDGDRRGEFFFLEVTRRGRFADTTVTEMVGWVREYREPPGERPVLAEADGCALYDVADGAPPGAFRSIAAGPIEVTGGAADLVLVFDERSGNYELDAEEAPLDLWEPGQRLRLRADGDDTGGFEVEVPVPDDIVIEAPDQETGLSRATPTLRWPPGPADAPPVRLRVTVAAGDMAWEILCDLPDVGEATLPAAAMDWIPAETEEVGLILTRRVTAVAATFPPVARLVFQLDARFALPDVPVVP